MYVGIKCLECMFMNTRILTPQMLIWYIFTLSDYFLLCLEHHLPLRFCLETHGTEHAHCNFTLFKEKPFILFPSPPHFNKKIFSSEKKSSLKSKNETNCMMVYFILWSCFDPLISTRPEILWVHISMAILVWAAKFLAKTLSEVPISFLLTEIL